jgi:hypothetical protein
VTVREHKGFEDRLIRGMQVEYGIKVESVHGPFSSYADSLTPLLLPVTRDSLTMDSWDEWASGRGECWFIPVVVDGYGPTQGMPNYDIIQFGRNFSAALLQLRDTLFRGGAQAASTSPGARAVMPPRQISRVSSLVKRFLKETHENFGLFATWPPNMGNPKVGDVGILEGGSFARIVSVSELGIALPRLKEGTLADMHFSSSAETRVVATTDASSITLGEEIELSIRFTRPGGCVFAAGGLRNVEIEDHSTFADSILRVYRQGRWRKEWLVVDSVYSAATAAVFISEDSSSKVVLRASGRVLPDPFLVLANPNSQLRVVARTGSGYSVIVGYNPSLLYTCLKVRDPLIGSATVVRVEVKQLLDS